MADDVRYYWAWIGEQAKQEIGHLYPEVRLPKELGGGTGTVVAWLWARTVASPDPALKGLHVPLVSTYWLSRKPGRETWVEPVVDRRNPDWHFEVRSGTPKNADAVTLGTKTGRGDFQCLLTGAPISAEYIRSEGRAHRLGDRLMAVAVEGERGRIYLAPTDAIENVARVPIPSGVPETELPEQALGLRVQNYGLTRHQDLFSPRQLTLLCTLSKLVDRAATRVLSDAKAAGFGPDPRRLAEGGTGAQAYADAIAVYLGMTVSRQANYTSTLCAWSSHPKDELAKQVFMRQALVMTWDYAESNPFSSSGGNLKGTAAYVAKVLELLVEGPAGTASQCDVRNAGTGHAAVVQTDPPYYDNISYAALSDFFYIWLRLTLRGVLPSLFSTLLTPKVEELVAEPGRHATPKEAHVFFEDGLRSAFGHLWSMQSAEQPFALFYAFKQSEESDAPGAATVSTGWQSMLQGLVDSKWSVVGTWPVRTEQPGGIRVVGRNSLASSIVLVCRKREPDAGQITRAEFRRRLRDELPVSLRALQHGNIAPVDVAQASIGPGMAIFSRYERVLEADGSQMTVRVALQLINEALDEFLAAEEGEVDPHSRFAITWFETYGWSAGSYGDAETLAKARNVSVEGVVAAGIATAAANRVQLVPRSNLDAEWNPSTTDRITVWDATQHLIRELETGGEQRAANLRRRLGPVADAARDLAYRLFNVCERRGRADDALAYNALVIAWPELERLAANVAAPAASADQLGLGLGAQGPAKSPRKARTKRTAS